MIGKVAGKRVATLTAGMLLIALLSPVARSEARSIWDDPEGDAGVGGVTVPGSERTGADLTKGTINSSGDELVFRVRQADLSPTDGLPAGLAFSWAFAVGQDEFRLVARQEISGAPAFSIESDCVRGDTGVVCQAERKVDGSIDAESDSFIAVIPLQMIGAREGSIIGSAEGPAAAPCDVCWTVDGSGGDSVIVDDAEVDSTYVVPGAPTSQDDEGEGDKGKGDKDEGDKRKGDKRKGDKRKGDKGKGDKPTKCKGVQIRRGADIQRALDSHSSGKRFCLARGIYRIKETLVPKAGQEIVGKGTRSIISGAKVVDATKEGGRWVITGQKSLGRSEINPDFEACRPVKGQDPDGMCIYRDQVFLNNVSLWQVGSLGELSRGEFYWNYGSNKIYLVDNPAGRRLEISAVADNAIKSSSPGVEVRNLVVEKFGTGVQSGAISAGRNWTIVGTVMRLNHGAGVHTGAGTVLRGNKINHNGQLGIHGGQETCAGAKGLVVTGNEISHNNAAGYNWGFEGGAAKWTHTDGLIVRNNRVHHNYGMGLWTDAANINTLYANNIVTDNYGMGINHELSYKAVIRDNIVKRNGFHHPVQGSAWGAGIFVDQSRNVEVYDNVVEGNSAGIMAVQDPNGNLCDYGVAEVANLNVHNNVVAQRKNLAAGLQLLETGDRSYYDSKGNRWHDNDYSLGDPKQGRHFYWKGERVTARAWRSYGHD